MLVRRTDDRYSSILSPKSYFARVIETVRSSVTTTDNIASHEQKLLNSPNSAFVIKRVNKGVVKYTIPFTNILLAVYHSAILAVEVE